MKMQLLFVVCFAALGELMVAGELEILVGGRIPIGPDDEDVLLKAQTLIQDKIEEEWKNEDGYNHTVTLKDVKVTKQIVNGILYHFHFKAVHNFVCSGSAKDCNSNNKSPMVQTCTAAIYKATGSNSNIEFARNNSGPKCH